MIKLFCDACGGKLENQESEDKNSILYVNLKDELKRELLGRLHFKDRLVLCEDCAKKAINSLKE